MNFKKLCLSLSVAIGLHAGVVLAADLTPDALVRTTTQDVLAVVKQDKAIQAGDNKKILALVDEKVLPHFDFGKMTRLAVGGDWRKASPEQQEALVREFRTLLVRTYSTALTGFKDQTVEVKPARLSSENDALVQSRINQPSGKPLAIDYKMGKGSKGWQVYDVTIDGISLVTSYRGDFGAKIQQGGIDGLLKSLAEKNRAGKK
jgi:phospholipid transport system substrate-binding protein